MCGMYAVQHLMRSNQVETVLHILWYHMIISVMYNNYNNNARAAVIIMVMFLQCHFYRSSSPTKSTVLIYFKKREILTLSSDTCQTSSYMYIAHYNLFRLKQSEVS